MAKERDLDRIFNDYDKFLASIGLGIQKDEKPKPSTFGKTKDESNILAKELEKSIFSRDNFMRGYRKLIIEMFESDPALLIKNGITEFDFTELKTNHNKLTKSDYCVIASKIFRNKEIYEFFLTFLETEVKQLFELMIWKEDLSDLEIINETGISICNTIERKNYGKTYFEKELSKGFLILSVDTTTAYDYHTNSNIKTFTVEMPVQLRRVLKEYYDKPLHYDFIPLTEEPNSEFISNTESEIFVVLPNLISYAQQGNIKTSGPGKVMVGGLNKIRKTLNINELYPETVSKELQNLKTYLLASLVVGEPKFKKEETFVGILKNYIDKVYIKKYNSHTHILTSLKGGHNLYNVQDVETGLLEIIKSLPMNQWISTQNIIDYGNFRSYDLNVSTIYEMCNYFAYEIEGRYGKEKKAINKSNYKKFANEPVLKGTLMLWACFGLLDIAYDTIDTSELGKTYYSVYDGIKAVRLTNLGAYLLGKTSDYEAPTVKQSYDLVFSTDNLIILVEGETNITDNLLANYADKVGANRYAVSNESFLKNVGSKKELKVKIDIFKQVVNNKLPPNWKVFFDNLDRKIHPLDQVNEVMVFKIPSDDPELIKLLIQNPVIKKLLIKAEDYQIIVSKKDYPTLRTKLKTYGYLLA